MNGKQIIREVKRYVNDTVYNYALLIDGEWGCGKTFFVKNDLKSALEGLGSGEAGMKVKYVSLYGIKSIDDVQESLVWELAEEARQANKKRTNRRIVHRTSKGEAVVDSTIASTRKIIGGLVKRFFPNTSIYDIAWDWLKLKSYVIIFDDLERCDCGLNEIFGFINGLVEHEGIKVIIVANEKEICSEIMPERIEQQYMVALDNRVNWPEYKDNSLFSHFNMKKNSNTISVDELENRRRCLFSKEESNEDYRRIREKLIGISMRYEADIDSITLALVEKTGYPADIQSAIKRNIRYILDRMDYYHHHNLRTIQFFLSRVIQLLNALADVTVDNEYKNKIEDDVIKECFNAAAEYKSDYKPPKKELAYVDSVAEEPGLTSIRKYVECGHFDEALFEHDILGMESVFKANIDSDDPYNQLNNGYYYMTQQECEEMLNSMIIRLENNRYPAFVYERILILVGKLEQLGFDSEYAVRMKKAIIENCKAEGISSELTVDRFYIDDEKTYKKISEYLLDINDGINSNAKIAKEKKFSTILNSPDWVEGLNSLLPKDRGYVQDCPVFIQAGAEEWINAVKRSSARDIHQFRFWMWVIYPQNSSRKSFSLDYPTLLSIHDAIMPENEKDLLRRYALELLKWQIEETYRINTGQDFSEHNNVCNNE